MIWLPKGKQSGGYCTYISEYGAPFIFSNFNGTSGDIDVLTHEAGHAFQVYESRGFEVPEYGFPTYEACEIHSMSMEFFTWPWMDRFFEDEADKYRFDHLASGLIFIPYGVTVDEFQHFVYENPDATPAERKQAWREIERKYLPHRNYDDNAYLEQGGFWHKQGHIFSTRSIISTIRWLKSAHSNSGRRCMRTNPRMGRLSEPVPSRWKQILHRTGESGRFDLSIRGWLCHFRHWQIEAWLTA